MTEQPSPVSADTVAAYMPPRRADSRKGQNGKVLVVGGSRIYHGAPIMASLAALRTGSDLVYTAVPKTLINAVRASSYDIIAIPMADQKLTRGAAQQLAGAIPLPLDSAAIGMGLAVTDGLSILVRRLTDMDIRLVLDAGALIPGIAEMVSNRNCILTPHAGEFKRVFGVEPPDDVDGRVEMVRQKAKGFGVTILLKGPVDVISDGETTYLCHGRIPAMTVGGTGDVLAGLTTGLLSRSRDSLMSAAAAAFINKRVGEAVYAQKGLHMAASDMLAVIPSVMKEFDSVV